MNIRTNQIFVAALVCMYCAACTSQVRSLVCFIVTIRTYLFSIDRARNGNNYRKKHEKPVYFELEILC